MPSQELGEAGGLERLSPELGSGDRAIEIEPGCTVRVGGQWPWHVFAGTRQGDLGLTRRRPWEADMEVGELFPAGSNKVTSIISNK